MTDATAWAILLPLGGAVLTFLAGPRLGRSLAALATLGTTIAVALVVTSVFTRGPLRHSVGGWGPPLGIDLRADGLSASMLIVIAAISAIVGVEEHLSQPRVEAAAPTLRLFTWAALDALVLSADVFNLYVALELTTLAAVSLIATAGDRDALTAALRYLLLALAGSLVYLLGVAILYGSYAALDLNTLGERIEPGAPASLALTLVTIGLCLKSGLFPLHGWMVPAYVSARPAVAALVSSLVGTSSFYVLLRLWVEIFPAEFELYAGALLGALGAAGVFWGSTLAFRQRRLATLAAYSSVAHVGYLFLFFPLGTPGAYWGCAYLALSHAAAKASIFLAVGTVERVAGRDELLDLRGLADHLPVTFFALALSGISLMGMPPSGGFVGKWLLVRAAVETKQWWCGVVLLAGGLLAAAYVFRVLRIAFLPRPPGLRLEPAPRRRELTSLTLALIALLFGMTPELPIELLRVRGAP